MCVETFFGCFMCLVFFLGLMFMVVFFWGVIFFKGEEALNLEDFK